MTPCLAVPCARAAEFPIPPTPQVSTAIVSTQILIGTSSVLEMGMGPRICLTYRRRWRARGSAARHGCDVGQWRRRSVEPFVVRQRTCGLKDRLYVGFAAARAPTFPARTCGARA